MIPVELADGVVLLRAPSAADVDRITDLCQDPMVARWTTVPSPYRRRDAEGFVRDLVTAGWSANKEATWGVRDPADGVLHGMVGVDLTDNGEIGFWLDPDVRGRGPAPGLSSRRHRAPVGEAAWRVARRLAGHAPARRSALTALIRAVPSGATAPDRC